jgi:large subunit ribosomal protein L4
MAKARVLNLDGREVETLTLPEALFGAEPRPHVVHQYVKMYLANQRQGTHSTLNRSRMEGGGAKPFRQKGTGRARQGTNISPLMPGGARAFGPTPRDYRQAMPKRMRRVAIRTCLSDKAQGDKVLVLDAGELEKPRTKIVASFLDKAGLMGERTLILSEGREPNLALSCRNLPQVEYKRASNVNPYDLVRCDTVVFTKGGLERAQEVFK